MWGVGLGCRGIVRVFIEKIPAIRPRWLTVLAENQLTHRSTRLAVLHDESAGPLRGTHLSGDLPAYVVTQGGFQEVITPPPALFIFRGG